MAASLAGVGRRGNRPRILCGCGILRLPRGGTPGAGPSERPTMTTFESVSFQLEQQGYQVKKIATFAAPEAGDPHAAYVVTHPTGLGCRVVIVRDAAAVSFRVYVPLLGDVAAQTAGLTEWVGANEPAGPAWAWMPATGPTSGNVQASSETIYERLRNPHSVRGDVTGVNRSAVRVKTPNCSSTTPVAT
jgi:hypothetical protein